MARVIEDIFFVCSASKLSAITEFANLLLQMTSRFRGLTPRTPCSPSRGHLMTRAYQCPK